MDSADLRRQIKKFFMARSLYLADESLTYFAEQLVGADREQCRRMMERVAQLVEQTADGSDLLTLERITDILKEVSRQKKHESEITFKLEDAVEWRAALVGDKLRKKLPTTSEDKSPWDKLSFDAYRERHELIRTLIDSCPDQHFDTIDSLLSRRGSRVRILAQLSRGASGNEFIGEGLTGAMRMRMDAASYEDGLYFEGGTFVFEGTCAASGDRLEVDTVRLPRLRRLAQSESVEGNSRNGTGKEMAAGTIRKDPNDRIVFMSDVHLGSDRVLKALYNILKGFSTSPPKVFVLCGPFLSIQQVHGYTDQASAAFRHLANILAEFSRDYTGTQFVLVPSADDPAPMRVLPRPPLLPVAQKCFKDHKNVHFASNPCRLIFKDQHIVILRDDMVEKLCRSAIFMPKNAKANAIPKLFCDTIWSQRHCSPLPLFHSPIQPHFDALFQLFPASDVLVVADRFRGFFEPADERRRLTLNPGPFSLGARHFGFLVYYPNIERVDHSAYDEEQD